MFFPVQLTKESCELIVAALRKLPHEQVHELVVDIATQANNALAPVAQPQTESQVPAEPGVRNIPELRLVDDEPK